jgi:hypothetical protein
MPRIPSRSTLGALLLRLFGRFRKVDSRKSTSRIFDTRRQDSLPIHRRLLQFSLVLGYHREVSRFFGGCLGRKEGL